MIFGLAITLLFSLASEAPAGGALLACATKAEKIRVSFAMENSRLIGLKLAEQGGSRRWECRLAPEYWRDEAQHVISGATLIFRPEDCAGGSLPERLSEKVTLRLLYNGTDIPAARIRWAEARQPEECVVSAFDRKGLGALFRAHPRGRN